MKKHEIKKECLTYWWKFDSFVSPDEYNYEKQETMPILLNESTLNKIEDICNKFKLNEVKEYLIGFADHLSTLNDPRFREQFERNYNRFREKQLELLAFKKMVEGWPKLGYDPIIPDKCTIAIKVDKKTVLEFNSKLIIQTVLKGLKSMKNNDLWFDEINTSTVLPYYDWVAIKNKYAYYLNEFLINKTGLKPNKRYYVIGKLYSFAGLPFLDSNAKEIEYHIDLKNEVRKTVNRIGKKISEPNFRCFY